MTTAHQVPAPTETVGEYNFAVVEHLHASGSGAASFSLTRCRTYEDGSLGRQVSYGLSGFDDFESAREFGLAWCRGTEESQTA